MNTKVQINWDDINQNDYQYFNAIAREHSTYKEMLYLNEQNYHNIYLRKHFITFKGNKYFIPNPFVSLFFEKDHTIIPDFITNYKKGQKHFKKNYHKKAPDENYIERMKQLFNDEFKRILTGIEFIYNDKVGFRNGLLSAYIEFEEANYDLFELLSKNEESNNYTQSQEPHKEALSSQRSEKPKQPELNKIWLSEPKISIDDLLTLGIEKGIWNDEYQIITAKGSLYGTGKTMLGSLFIALKGFAVSENIDYKEAGKVFCSFFNIPINEKTKEPYKAFSSGNEKLIRELKRAFNIK